MANLKRGIGGGGVHREVVDQLVDSQPVNLATSTAAVLSPTSPPTASAPQPPMWLSWANAFKQLFNFTSAPTQQGLHSEVPSGAPSPPATGQATGFEESSTPLSTTTSSSPPIPPDHPSPSSHHPTFWSLQKVKASIEELEKMFGCLHAKAGKELSKREYEDEGFLEEFRSRLLLLPVRKATLHVRFFDTTEKNIVEAKSTKIILAILCRFVDYRNYEILYYVVLKFCGVPLQESMKEFSKALEEFETATSVDVYLSAIPDEVDEELMNGFSEMVVKIKMPESQCTLLEIRKLNKAIIEKSSLCSHSVYVGAVSRNCVVVRFRFPSSAVGWALAAVTPDFMSTHYITEVAVDGCRLSLIQNQRVNLVCGVHIHNCDKLLDGFIVFLQNKELIKLIAASVSEDVTRVVSLLNSGADIHTDHEVAMILVHTSSKSRKSVSIMHSACALACLFLTFHYDNYYTVVVLISGRALLCTVPVSVALFKSCVS